MNVYIMGLTNVFIMNYLAGKYNPLFKHCERKAMLSRSYQTKTKTFSGLWAPKRTLICPYYKETKGFSFAEDWAY